MLNIVFYINRQLFLFIFKMCFKIAPPPKAKQNTTPSKTYSKLTTNCELETNPKQALLSAQCYFSVLPWISISHARPDSYLKGTGLENTCTLLESQFCRNKDWEYWEQWLRPTFLKAPRTWKTFRMLSLQGPMGNPCVMSWSLPCV